MSIFLLPTIVHNMCLSNEDDIDFKMTSDNPGVIISHSLYNSLCETKVQIEQNGTPNKITSN